MQAVAAECEALGGTATVIICDVAIERDCQHLAEAAALALDSRIDFLVLNAGIGMRGRVEEIQDPSIYRRLIDVNALGPVWLTHYCLPHVKAAKGHIVVVSSVSGLFGLAGLAGYCMSKAALHGFFEALRNEGTVGVTMVCPGFMDTDMPKKNLSPDGKPVGDSGGALSRGTPWLPLNIARAVVRAADERQRDVSSSLLQLNPVSYLMSYAALSLSSSLRGTVFATSC